MRIGIAMWTVVASVLLTASIGAAEDKIEFKNGAVLTGDVIARDATSVTIETKIGEKLYKRRYALEHVLAITAGGRRELIGAKPKPENGNGRGNGQICRIWTYLQRNIPFRRVLKIHKRDT